MMLQPPIVTFIRARAAADLFSTPRR